ncbi:unnamed protein product, partial [Prorocentrum cordatum]
APNLSSPPCLWHYVGCPKAHAATRGRGFAWAQSAGFPGAPGRALRYRDAIVAPPPAPESFRRGAIGSSAAGVHSARRPPTAAQRPPGGGRAPGGAGRRNQGRGVERAAGRGKEKREGALETELAPTAARSARPVAPRQSTVADGSGGQLTRGGGGGGEGGGGGGGTRAGVADLLAAGPAAHWRRA